MIEPNFKTEEREFTEEEKAKLKTKGLRVDGLKVKEAFHDSSRDDLEKEVSIVAKSFGIYLEFHRDKMKSNSIKDWIYMVRVPIPGGGPISAQQWRVIDDISNKYTVSDAYTGSPQPSIKLTTRQAIQFHHIKKRQLVDIIKDIASTGFLTLNGCGDNVRNTKGCPISKYYGILDVNALASRIAKYFKLPSELFIQVFELNENELIRREGEAERFDYVDNLLPRKFKIGIAGVIKNGDKYVVDNCVEIRSDDIGIAPIVTPEGKLNGYQIYVGGSMGENNTYPSFSALGFSLGFVDHEDELMRTLDGIVKVYQDWGDRKNRHWARLKYLVYKKGLKWLREKLREYSGVELKPMRRIDLNTKDLHLGWLNLGEKLGYGIFVENGRLIDNENGKVKSMIRYIAEKLEHVKFYITPNQHLIITEIEESEKEYVEGVLKTFNYGYRNGKPYSSLRINSTACVGFPTCKLSFTNSERFLPRLIDELERRGVGNVKFSIGLSGCVAQCSRPALHPICWIGSGYELYMLKVGGGNNSLGEPLIDWDENVMYLYQVPSNRLADVTEALVELYEKNKDLGEDIGEVLRKLGNKKIIEWLKSHEKTKDLMKPCKFERKIEGYREYHELLNMRLKESYY